MIEKEFINNIRQELREEGFDNGQWLPGTPIE